MSRSFLNCLSSHQIRGMLRSMMTKYACLWCCVIALFYPIVTSAQQLPSPGELVRVWGPMPSIALMKNESIESELLAIRGDTLVFKMLRSGTQVAVERDRIHRLDVRRPRSPGRGAWLGAAAGLGFGVVAGFVLAARVCDDDSCDFGVPVLSGGVGAGVGALIGYALPGTRWDTVELER